MLTCDKCSATIAQGANFCPQCGDPVTDADKPAVIARDTHIASAEISFGYSSSANYERALQILGNIPESKTEGEGKKIKHSVILPVTETELLMNLYDLVGNWKSSRMLINGKISSKKDLTYYGLGCYQNRQHAYKPDQYCYGEKEYDANIWGCKRLNMPIHHWADSWLDYGEFDDSGVWYFDKKRIKHDLENGIRENELCPVLVRTNVMRVLDKLPDSIDPNNDSNWSYRIEYRGGERVATGIRPIISSVNEYVVGSYKPAWDIDEDFREQFDNYLEAASATKSSNKNTARNILFLLLIVLGVAAWYFDWLF